ncbi:MAG: hypothetical protein VYE73_09940 [Acidobacteriota bacterium]|nr:hypothetical protein [Acidobacteriota bacterium]
MKRVRVLSTTYASGALVALCLVATAAGAQQQSGSARTPWGAPDIQGMWDFRTLTPFERPDVFGDRAVLTPEEAKAFAQATLDTLNVDVQRSGEGNVDVEGAYNNFWFDWGTELSEDLRTSLIVDPPDGKLPPITEETRVALRAQNAERRYPVRDLFSFSAGSTTFRPEGPEFVGLSERCLQGFNAGPPLSPSAYNNNLEIIQTRDYVVLVTEMIHDARIVSLDGRPHLPSELRRWQGDSRGHWDGNTLVVETTNFSDKTPAFQLPVTIANVEESGGVGSSVNVRLVERFTPIGEGRLLYEYTLSDPKTFTAPFTVAIPLRASTQRMFEYACHEGNYAMGGMLRGARLLEAEAAASGGQ